MTLCLRTSSYPWSMQTGLKAIRGARDVLPLEVAGPPRITVGYFTATDSRDQTPRFCFLTPADTPAKSILWGPFFSVPHHRQSLFSELSIPQGHCPVQGNKPNTNLFWVSVPLPSPSSGLARAEAFRRKGDQGVVWLDPPADTQPAPASLQFGKALSERDSSEGPLSMARNKRSGS